MLRVKDKTMTRREFVVLAAASASLAPTFAFAAGGNLRQAARDAYLFTLPLIEMSGVRTLLLARGGSFNAIYNRPTLADHTSRAVTSPNNDTLYGAAWLDLSQGPVTVSLPALGGRYLSLQLMDMYTNSFVVLGARTTGNEAGVFTIIGPDDQRTAGMSNVVRSPTRIVWALLRVLVDGPSDFDAARAVQNAVTISGSKAGTGSIERVAMAVATDAPWTDYFAVAQRLLAESPPPATDRAMLQRIADLDLISGKPFAPDSFTADQKTQIEAGLADGRALVIDPRFRGVPADGWFYPGSTLGNFGQDYIPRAIVARTGLAALPREEAMYMRPEGNGGDSLYDGNKNWRLHFDAGGLPPVDGFWSLSMYERTAGGQSFFTNNALKRYAIGNRTPGLKTNGDGSTDIWIGHDNPGAERESNWLPAPSGPFTMSMRCYLPRQPILNGSYRLPRVTPAS